ncbi:MAG: hypothetical protein WC849_00475 [Candidatus Paceibacterota bacterium]
MKRLSFLFVLLSLVIVGCNQTNENLTTEQVSRFLEKKCGYTILSEVFVHNSTGTVFFGSFEDTKLNFFDDFVYKTIDDISFSVFVNKDGRFLVVFLNDNFPEPKIVASSEIKEIAIRNCLLSKTKLPKGTMIR